MNTQELSKVCRQVRRDIITMTANAGSGHPGGSLSAVELMTSVFFNHMRVDPSNPHDPDRDRFVLSKGHCAPGLYAVLGHDVPQDHGAGLHHLAVGGLLLGAAVVEAQLLHDGLFQGLFVVGHIG